MTRAPYTHAELRPLMNPGSVAVIGASPRPGSFGGRTLENLAGYSGQVFPINAKYPEIGGQTCYASLADLPQVPDLVVITTPAGSVEPLLEDCIAAGVPAVMVYASGFSEMGDEAAIATQQRLAARARGAGVRLLGPNCVGLLNYSSGARISFAGTPEGQVTGGPAIGLICQSGALGFALAQSMERGVSFSHVLSCGNSSDVDVADWVSALADDPTCSAIACAFEGVSDPLKFLAAAQVAWDRGKPLIVHKMAVGEEGAAAAMSHTASLAGSAELWGALFERGGAIAVEDFDALVETAWFFAKAPAPKGDGLAMLSGSGGAAIMTSDFAEMAGLAMPQPTAPVVERLREMLPPYVPARNPCDATAGVINDLDTLVNCADALLGDPNFGALIFGYTYAYATATDRQPRLSALAEKHGKPVIYVWLSQYLEGPGTEQAERDPNVMVFRSMRRACVVLKAWIDRAQRRIEAPGSWERPALGDLLDGVGALGEGASKQLLAAYGIDTPKEWRVTSPEQAMAAGEAIGGALALKVDSPDILHKSDAGGVALNIEGGGAAAESYLSMMEACRAAVPGARIDGVLVQEMVPPGLEIIAGFRNAEGFGPVLTVGLGGVLTEVLADTATALAPVSAAEAEDMLRSLRGAALLQGYRGAAGVDVPRLAQVVAAISRMAVDLRGQVAELDVNPLICLPDRVVAVDGLAILEPGGPTG